MLGMSVSCRGRFLSLMLFVVGVIGVSGCQEGSPQTGSLEGKYDIVTALRPDSRDVVRVEEFIAFSCEHCYDYHSGFSDLYAHYGDRVERVTVPFARPGDPLGPNRLYFVAEKHGVAGEAKERLYEAFDGIEGKELESSVLESIADELGILENYRNKKDSPEIDARVKQAREKAAAYGVPGTPILVIAGQLRVYADKDNFKRIVDQILISE